VSVSLETFKADFPELALAGDDLISAKLAKALRQIDTTILGDLADDLQAQYAARFLALTPFGAQAGLRLKDPGETVYDEEITRLEQRVGIAYRPVLE
jgi:hypothetical protein